MTDFDPKRRELLKVTVVSGGALATGSLLPNAATSATAQSTNKVVTENANMSPTSNVTLRVNGTEHRMSGNICRCGAYDNIVAAIQDAARVSGSVKGG